MKKRILTVAVAALALAACSKNETVEVADSNLIGFEGAFVGNPTRAITEITNPGEEGGITSFLAYGGYDGTQVFTAQEVAPNANREWTYAPLQKWVDNQTYKFAAYTPALANVTPTWDYATGSLTFSNVVVNATTNQTDFVYDQAVVIESGDGSTTRSKVAFTFEHMLSMIQFTLKSGFPEEVVLNISDFKVYGMNSTANLTNGTWAAPTTAITQDAAITLSTGSVQATTTPTDYVDNFVVIPQSIVADQVTVSFRVTADAVEGVLADAINEPLTATLPVIKWEAGMRYNYIVTIDGQTLDFITFDDPVVTGWDEQEVDMGNLVEEGATVEP